MPDIPSSIPQRFKTILMAAKFRQRCSSSPIPLPKSVSPTSYRLLHALARCSQKSTSSNKCSPPPFIISAFSTELGSFQPRKQCTVPKDKCCSKIAIFFVLLLFAIAMALSVLTFHVKINKNFKINILGDEADVFGADS